MSEDRFRLLKSIIEAPSPVNLEGSMTFGVIEPYVKSLKLPKPWRIHKFIGSASVVVDSGVPRAFASSDAGEKEYLTVMVCGHADKIRMQVRHIEKSSGKIYIDSDSFLPIALLGHDVSIYAELPDEKNTTHNRFRRIKGTVEALGAIHFGEAAHRAGAKGVSPEMLYIDLGAYGADAYQRVLATGIKPGDSVLMDRNVRRSMGSGTFSGAYLDNGIGSFITTDLIRLLTEEYPSVFDRVRVLFTVASHEEIGRFGSRIMAARFSPELMFAVDVNHDYVNAPGVASKRFTPLAMGSGFTISVGSVASHTLNDIVKRSARRADIPYQLDCVGRDTGTDAMAGVLGNVDCAVVSLGVPTRNMHTASEAANTHDLDACLYGIAESLKTIVEEKIDADYFRNSHVDLSRATLLEELPPPPTSPKTTKKRDDNEAKGGEEEEEEKDAEHKQYK